MGGAAGGSHGFSFFLRGQTITSSRALFFLQRVSRTFQLLETRSFTIRTFCEDFTRGLPNHFLHHSQLSDYKNLPSVVDTARHLLPLIHSPFPSPASADSHPSYPASAPEHYRTSFIAASFIATSYPRASVIIFQSASTSLNTFAKSSPAPSPSALAYALISTSLSFPFAVATSSVVYHLSSIQTLSISSVPSRRFPRWPATARPRRAAPRPVVSS